MKKNISSADIFELRYKKYYQDILVNIIDKSSKHPTIFPSQDEQAKIIERASAIDCSFRYLDDMHEDRIHPLYKTDPLFPFASSVNNRDFFKIIHPAYLIPYLVYGAFAHELVKELKREPIQLLHAEYQINVPVNLPGKRDYFWFTQKTRLLATNEFGQPTRFINYYLPVRKFKEFNDKAENIFIEPAILQNQVLFEALQEILEKKLTAYYQEHVFKGHQLHYLTLRARGEKTKYTPSSVFDMNKQIKGLMELHTGYDFPNIKSTVKYLQQLRVISLHSR